MKKQVLTACAAGLLLMNLALPASAVYIDGGTASPPTPVAAYPGYQGGEAASAQPDKADGISFPDLEQRMRASNPTVLSFQSTMDSQLAFDRASTHKKLVDAINSQADLLWYMTQAGMTSAETAGLSASITSMREQVEQLTEENYTEQMETLTRQIDNAIRQIIAGAETLYINILSLEETRADVLRALESLDKTYAEMTLRYELGQISQLALSEFESTYRATQSQADTLKANLEKMKTALQSMLGEELTGELTLVPLSGTTDEQERLASLDYEEALTKAKEQSFTLYQADKTLEDAQEDWKDGQDNPSATSKYKMAEKTYQAAVHTYESTVSSFALSFRNLYHAIPEAEQTLKAAQSALTFQQKSMETTRLKHQLGQISDSALRTAENELQSAQSAVDAASIALFTAYHNYAKAVNYGIVE